MNEIEQNDYVRQALRQSMPDDLPAAVAERLESRLTAFGQRFDAELRIPRFSAIRRVLRRRFVRWTTAAVATAALAAVLLLGIPQAWHPAESSAWAEVVKAVAQKPWLHCVSTHNDGTKTEGWFSVRRGVLTGRLIKPGSKWGGGGDPEGRTAIDTLRNTSDYYDPDNNLIVRTSGDPFREGGDPFVAIFSAFTSGNPGGTIDAGRFRLVPEQQRVVVGLGKRWIEYRLIQRGGNENGMYENVWIVSVDPDTQLPFRLQQGSRLASDPSKTDVECRHEIDYPATGSEDIYALGVPKSAKIVDRTLRSDVVRLAKETAAPRRWADDKFSALVVESREDQQWWQGQSIYRVWKDGLCWRVDHSMGPVTEPLDKPPPEATNPTAWWTQKANERPFRPESRSDGKWCWEYETKTRRPTPADTAAGWPKNTMVVVSTEKHRRRPVERDHFRVEYPLGFGRPTNPLNDLKLLPGLEASVAPEPKSGPPNTVLLEVRNPNWKPCDFSEPLAPKSNPQIWRFWIDPARDHLVMRDERLVTREGKEEIAYGFAIEEVVQDSRGRWYPSVIRRFKAVYFAPDKWEDKILRFYYDFTAPLPEDVFKAD